MPEDSLIGGADTATSLVDASDSTGTEVFDAGTDATEVTGENQYSIDGSEPEGGTEQPEGEREAQQAQQGRETPSQLSKMQRELRQQHPEFANGLRTLNDGYYQAQAFKDVYSSPDEARASKALIESLGGDEGISKMRSTIEDIESFDAMLSEGDPRAIDGIAEGTPEGFKKLVPVALERLAKMDAEAYAQIMRGPLLAELESAGLNNFLSYALEEVKQAAGDPTNAALHLRYAQDALTRVGSWIQSEQKREEEFRSHRDYHDPRVKDLERREASLKQNQVQTWQDNVSRDLKSYRDSTIRPEIDKLLAGKNVTAAGRSRFEDNVRMEMTKILNADPRYGRGLKALYSQGKVSEAVKFGTPFVDKARRLALQTVNNDMFGTAQAARRSSGTQQAEPARQQSQSQQRAASQGSSSSDKPRLVLRRPADEDIDWNKTTRLDFITHKAYLTSGERVAWK